MNNETRIRNMSTWDLAEFLHKVSCGEAKFTVCEKECAKCDMSDSWCISEIAEWLKEQTND